jgi:hypothetical protein
MTTIGLWTDLEGHVGLWCGCFPALQPILRAFLSSVGASRLLSSYKNNGYGAYANNKPAVSASKGWRRSNAIPLSSQQKDTQIHAMKDDNSSQKGIIDNDSEGFEMDTRIHASKS